MLLDGFNHVAILTNDSARLQAFYREVFDATVETTTPPPPPDAPPDIDVKLSFIYVGPNSELNVFEISGNDEAKRQTPMFGRGRIDHLALMAESIASITWCRTLKRLACSTPAWHVASFPRFARPFSTP